jgi:uncharacterized membrane protein
VVGLERPVTAPGEDQPVGPGPGVDSLRDPIDWHPAGKSGSTEGRKPTAFAEGGSLTYRWWVFLHILGVFGFLLGHGVSVGVAFRLRRERDPARINALLELSGSSLTLFFFGLLVLVAAGVVAGFIGKWWSDGWIWTALAVLVATSAAMSILARPYYKRVRLVAEALASGSEAVTEDQFVSILRSPLPLMIAGLGFAALLVILWLMMFKPF